MARTAWKFSKLYKDEINLYNKEFKLLKEKQGKQIIGLKSRNLIINPINYTYRYIFHLGNCFISKTFIAFCIKSKGLQFLKFTKPFNFRSKKKK